MAAETAALAGARVALYDAMPSPGRKFLLAGRGGLNLTHAEPYESFVGRYGPAAARLRSALDAFGPAQIRDWAEGLGIATFVGTSGRVFPTDFKAAPLLRAWRRRLSHQGVALHVRHRWLGWDGENRLRFAAPDGDMLCDADAAILALGGASWPHLGSDGAWVAALARRGVDIAPLRPANCGFDRPWSAHFREKAAGRPLKTVALSHGGHGARGDVVITETGIEGGPVYALSASLRDAIAAEGAARLLIDLKPDWSEARLAAQLARPRGSRSLAAHLDRNVGISGAAALLLREILPAAVMENAGALAAAIKALPLDLAGPRPLAEAISTAGGIRLDEVDDTFMLRRLPGIFAAGEMLDWEAPTGGYLLTACLATGRATGANAAAWAISNRR